MDDLELQLNLIAVLLGFKDFGEMEDFKRDAYEGLIRFGGSFASNLGRTLLHADMTNSGKIINTFRDVLTEHAELWRKHLVNHTKE